jgi:hypothetical protein
MSGTQRAPAPKSERPGLFSLEPVGQPHRIERTNRPKIRAFIAMPFAKEFDALFQAILSACDQVNVEAVRADSQEQPGPIINQIFAELEKADLLIAEVGSKNSNVYYEIGLAHCIRIPSILVARNDQVDRIPFDLRHNRVITFESKDLGPFVSALTKSIDFVKEAIIGHAPTLKAVVDDTSVGRSNLKDLIKEVGNGFDFIDPQLVEEKLLPDNKGFLVEIRDAYSGRKARFVYDLNGNIRNKISL